MRRSKGTWWNCRSHRPDRLEWSRDPMPFAAKPWALVDNVPALRSIRARTLPVLARSTRSPRHRRRSSVSGSGRRPQLAQPSGSRDGAAVRRRRSIYAAAARQPEGIQVSGHSLHMRFLLDGAPKRSYAIRLLVIRSLFILLISGIRSFVLFFGSQVQFGTFAKLGRFS